MISIEASDEQNIHHIENWKHGSNSSKQIAIGRKSLFNLDSNESKNKINNEQVNRGEEKTLYKKLQRFQHALSKNDGI